MADRCFIVHDVEQRSEEWRQLRCGLLTASHAGEMLAKTQAGKWAAGRRNLLMRLVLERLTRKVQENGYQSPAMLAGIEREEDAISAYEAKTDRFVRRCGFLTHTSLRTGASLDGYLGDFETLISVKCRQPAAHWDFLRSGKIPDDAHAQMRHELWLTGAAQHEYVSWNPDFPEQAQLRITVLPAAEFNLAEYDGLAIAFLEEVDREVALVDGWHVTAGVA